MGRHKKQGETMAKNQKKETAKKEETSDNKNMLNIIHWIITVILLGAVAWLGFVLHFAYTDITISNKRINILMEHNLNTVECINKNVTECELSEYRSQNIEKEWQEISELYKKFPTPQD